MQNLLFIIIGAVLAIGIILLARTRGSYEKEKIFYSVGLIFAALVYVGFGMFSDSLGWKLTEFGGVLIYALFVFLGLRFSGWFLSIGWALHVLWDVALHGHSADFVPFWYPIFCVGFDLFLAGYIGFREWRLK